MRPSSVLILLLALVLSAPSQTTGQTNDITFLRTKLSNFEANIKFASTLLDTSKLVIRSDQTIEDVIAFGFVNVALKSHFPLTARHTPDFDRILSEQLTDQISAGCAWPGPKPTKDAKAWIRFNAFIMPGYYNKTVLITASDNKLGTFASIELTTSLPHAKVLYFPVLKEPEREAVASLPTDVRTVTLQYLKR